MELIIVLVSKEQCKNPNPSLWKLCKDYSQTKKREFSEDIYNLFGLMRNWNHTSALLLDCKQNTLSKPCMQIVFGKIYCSLIIPRSIIFQWVLAKKWHSTKAIYRKTKPKSWFSDSTEQKPHQHLCCIISLK